MELEHTKETKMQENKNQELEEKLLLNLKLLEKMNSQSDLNLFIKDHGKISKLTLGLYQLKSTQNPMIND